MRQHAATPNPITHLEFQTAIPVSRSSGTRPAVHPPVLRITQVSLTASAVTLKVEGRVAAAWVQVLEEECRRHRAAGRDVRLDFAEVTMVDGAGIVTLRRLTRSRVTIVEASALVLALLAEEECR